VFPQETAEQRERIERLLAQCSAGTPRQSLPLALKSWRKTETDKRPGRLELAPERVH
jgi:hypothetical protein